RRERAPRRGDLELADRTESVGIDTQGLEVPGLGNTPGLDRRRGSDSAAKDIDKAAKGCKQRFAGGAHFASSSQDPAELPDRSHYWTDGPSGALLLGCKPHASH